jgi:hypothetical protein
MYQQLELPFPELRHAVVHDRTIDSTGRVESEREFHYSTCEACKVNELAIEITKLLRPDDWPQWKWRVEAILSRREPSPSATPR